MAHNRAAEILYQLDDQILRGGKAVTREDMQIMALLIIGSELHDLNYAMDLIREAIVST